MAGLVVNSIGGNIDVMLNDISEDYKRIFRNLKTGMLVIEFNNDMGVSTNLMLDFESFNVSELYTYDMVDSINGIQITSNAILFDEIKKMIEQ